MRRTASLPEGERDDDGGESELEVDEGLVEEEGASSPRRWIRARDVRERVETTTGSR